MLITLSARAAQTPSLIQFELAEETAVGSGLPGVFSGIGAVEGILDQYVELTINYPYTNKALYGRAYLEVENQPQSDYSSTVQLTPTTGIPQTSTLFDPIDVNGAVTQLLASGTALAYLYTDPGSGADSPAGAPPLPNVPLIHSGSLTHVLEIQGYTKPADFRWFEWEYDHTTGGWAALAKTTSLSIVHTRLVAGLSYRYRVKAVDQAGNASAFATTGSAPATVSSVRPDQIIAEQITVGSITAGKIAVVDLSAISANLGTITTGIIRNPSNTAGIRIDSGLTLPSTWTTYLDLAATNSNNILQATSALAITADGRAVFSGTVNAGALYADTILSSGTLTIAGPVNTENLFVQSDSLFTDSTKQRFAIENDNFRLWDNAETGIASGTQSSTTLQDITKNWPTNYWSTVGAEVQLYTGIGAGQTRTIVSGTGNTIVISPAWDTNPVTSNTGYRLTNVQRINAGDSSIGTTSVTNVDSDWDNTAGAGGIASGTSSWTIINADTSENGSFVYNDLTVANIPAVDNKYTLNFTININATAFSNDVLPAVVVNNFASIYYRTSAVGAFVLLDSSNKITQTINKGTLGTLQSTAFSKQYTITGVTTYLEFRVQALGTQTGGLGGLGTIIGTVVMGNTTWSTGTGIRNARTLRLWSRAEPDFAPALMVEPLNTLPTDAAGRRGDQIFVSDTPYYHNGTNWRLMAGGNSRHVNVTAAGTGASTGTVTLMSHILPTLANGDSVEITVTGSTSGSANTKTVSFELDTTPITQLTYTAAQTGNWSIRLTMVKDGSGTQYLSIHNTGITTTPSMVTSSTGTSLSANILNVKGQTTNAADEITAEVFIVNIYRA